MAVSEGEEEEEEEEEVVQSKECITNIFRVWFIFSFRANKDNVIPNTLIHLYLLCTQDTMNNQTDLFSNVGESTVNNSSRRRKREPIK